MTCKHKAFMPFLIFERNETPGTVKCTDLKEQLDGNENFLFIVNLIFERQIEVSAYLNNKTGHKSLSTKLFKIPKYNDEISNRTHEYFCKNVWS